MKKIAQTDWMIMGMIHVYKILDKTRQQDPNADLNDVDYDYLVDLQKRNIENPDSLSCAFPFVFEKVENASPHDNVHLGMMNVFHLLDKCQSCCNLNALDPKNLISSLVEELEDKDLYEHYDDLFIEVDSSLESLK